VVDEDNTRGSYTPDFNARKAQETVTAAVSSSSDEDDALSYFQKLAEEWFSQGKIDFLFQKSRKKISGIFFPYYFFDYWYSLIFSDFLRFPLIYSVEPFLYGMRSSMSSRITVRYSCFKTNISLFLFSNFSSYS